MARLLPPSLFCLLEDSGMHVLEWRERGGGSGKDLQELPSPRGRSGRHEASLLGHRLGRLRARVGEDARRRGWKACAPWRRGQGGDAALLILTVPSRKPFLNLRGSVLSVRIRPVPSVRRRRALPPQLSAMAGEGAEGWEGWRRARVEHRPSTQGHGTRARGHAEPRARARPWPRRRAAEGRPASPAMQPGAAGQGRAGQGRAGQSMQAQWGVVR